MNFLKKLFKRKSKEAKAVLKAANHIEKNPQNYRFMKTTIPEKETDCGCVLGWIGYYLGYKESYFLSDVTKELGFRNTLQFYDFLEHYENHFHNDPNKVVIALRKLAKRL